MASSIFLGYFGGSSSGGANVGGMVTRDTLGFYTNSNMTGVDVLLEREGAGILAQRNGTAAQVHRIYNNFQAANDYEAFEVNWQMEANRATMGTFTGSSASPGRNLVLFAQGNNGQNNYSGVYVGSPSGTAPFLRLGRYNASMQLMTTGSTGNIVQVGDLISSATSGTVSPLAVVVAYNQTSGTASNTDLLISRTETAVGSGAQWVVRGDVSGSTVFGVSNTGRLTFGGTVSAAATVTTHRVEVTIGGTPYYLPLLPV